MGNVIRKMIIHQRVESPMSVRVSGHVRVRNCYTYVPQVPYPAVAAGCLDSIL